MNVATTPAAADNGVNVDALLGAKAALADAPPAAQFVWSAQSEWQNGAHTVSKINKFFGLGEEQTREATFTVESDHPALFAASDHAATPLEIVLAALASCLTGAVASVAQHRGIQLNRVNATVEGDVDMRGILGIDADVRLGFNEVRVKFEIDADASDDDIAALVSQAQKRSAVYDIVTNPTNVRVSVN